MIPDHLNDRDKWKVTRTTMCLRKLLICVNALLSLQTSLAVGAAKPNLVFIMADDCTFRDIGCYGGQAYTPHVDALAKQGMRFTHCFQTAPMCSPTRHSLYTGLYPVKSGAYANHTFVFEMNNLADDPQYTQVIKDLKETLDHWMASQGDEGVATELRAFERMLSGNAEYQAWAKKHRTVKKPKNY
jgi:hypothetical protein